jgi:DNA polymerase-3 subunit epsilon
MSPAAAVRPFVVLDTETTGFYPEAGDEIIELAAEKLVGGLVVATFHALVQPSRSVPPEATAVHGLDDAFVRAHGLAPADVFPGFAAFAAGTVLVGHNIRRFDLPFLAAHFAAVGLPPPDHELLDTLELARATLALPNYKLGTIATHFGIPVAGAHRAAADVAITRQVLLRLLDHTRR